MRKAFGPKVVLDGVSLNLNRGDRIAVIGRSGIGKSTLLKLLVGAYKQLDAETKPYTLAAGRRRDPLGPRRERRLLRAGPPRVARRDGEGHDAVRVALPVRHAPAPRRRSARILGRLLFSGDSALKPTEALTGGEAARLLLGKIVLGRHNVLVLDEPTNHLDIESIEGLLEGLLKFEGTVVFVSHDHHFVARLATRVIELRDRPAGDARPGCEVVDYGGTYEEFLER